jgi:hypothetical protein
VANRKISDLAALTAPASGDLFPVVDISEVSAADRNKKITYGTLLTAISSTFQPVPAGRVLYVDTTTGSDTAAGDSEGAPLKTITAALAQAQAGDCLSIGAGTYVEVAPMIVPRDVSLAGDDLRNTVIRPTSGTATNNLFLVDSGTRFFSLTFAGHQAGSFAVAFNPNANNATYGASGLGAFVQKSPYIQNCTSYTAQDDGGLAGSTSDGTTGGGMEVDGSKCAPNSPIRSMVVDSYTQVNLDGPGCLVKNDGYAQLVSCFGTFCSYHVKAETGGQVNLSNSTTDFGTYGLIADGRSATPVFSGTGASAASQANQVNVTSLSANRLGGSNRPGTGQVFDLGGASRTVTGAVPISGGYTVTFYPKLTSAYAGGSIGFYQRSQISTGAHTMEFVGSGTNYLALPWNGGVPIQANEIVELNGGRVFSATTDHLGDFRVGEQFSVNGTTGEVTINTSSFNISGLNLIGPFSRDGGQTSVGVQLREVSNNTTLLASTGTADGNTAPTQFAVKTYIDDRVGSTATPQFAGLGLGTAAVSNWELVVAGGALQNRSTVTATSGTYTLDVRAANEFLTNATIAGATTINLSNISTIPNGYVWRGVLTFAYTSGTISWFTGNSGYTVKWDGGLAMTPTASDVEKVVIEVVGGTTTIEIAPLKGRA